MGRVVVNYRIGSLEVYNLTSPTAHNVNYRIGSLEGITKNPFEYRDVNYRIGSLEVYNPITEGFI